VVIAAGMAVIGESALCVLGEFYQHGKGKE
jgi:hypothetical protein